MVKRREERSEDKSDNLCTKRKSALVIIALGMLFYSCMFVLYYTVIVVINGDTVQSDILTSVTNWLNKIVTLFVDAW